MVRFSDASTASDPDANLMLQVKAGSEEAFNELVRRYEERVRGIITHLMGGTAFSDDLTQDVFMRVYRARRSYVVGAKFSTWLFTIVNNVVSNARRGLSRCREVSFDKDVAKSRRFSESFSLNRQDLMPSHHVESLEVAALVRRCIARLVPRQRAAIELCDIQGFSYSRVAKA
ncbi:MAG: RNA polymerase sigma factor, partial [Planctomycetia bacterium]|nr:RNA polymerase sigma factor [Planctomycetia bacterium]